jgi:hypothetical protein
MGKEPIEEELVALFNRYHHLPTSATAAEMAHTLADSQTMTPYRKKER